MAGVSRGHSTGVVSREGPNNERMSTVSSSRDEPGRQKPPERETTEQAKQVKPAGIARAPSRSRHETMENPTRECGKRYLKRGTC